MRAPTWPLRASVSIRHANDRQAGLYGSSLIERTFGNPFTIREADAAGAPRPAAAYRPCGLGLRELSGAGTPLGDETHDVVRDRPPLPAATRAVRAPLRVAPDLGHRQDWRVPLAPPPFPAAVACCLVRTHLRVRPRARVKIHAGWASVAFVIDVYARMVAGCQPPTSLRSDLASTPSKW